MLRVVFVLRSTEVYPALFRFVGPLEDISREQKSIEPRKEERQRRRRSRNSNTISREKKREKTNPKETAEKRERKKNKQGKKKGEHFQARAPFY